MTSLDTVKSPLAQNDKNDASKKDTPLIWLIISDKPGDNAQVEMIADALGLPYEIRRVIPKPKYEKGKPWFSISLHHLDLEKSDELEAPWPDVILTIGRRSTMAALWVKKMSGGRSKIILLGRPKRWKDQFELIIIPSQYSVPPAANVLQLDFPLMQGKNQEIAIAAEAQREPWSKLPRPLTALFIGGQTDPFRMGIAEAEDLLNRAVAAAGDGFLYISTSRRTPPSVTDYLEKNLPENAKLFRWSPNAEGNPYLALLGLADQFIVTGDSISMMVEVARLGRPLAIYSLPVRHPALWSIKKRFSEWAHREGNWVGKALYKLGILRYGRDLTNIHQRLCEQRLASRLGDDWIRENRQLASELERTVTRIRELI